MRVILFVLDGLRPDGFATGLHRPHVDRLISPRCPAPIQPRTVMPSSTLPCHTSMFRGVPPQRHGILTKLPWVPQVRPIPSLVDVPAPSG